MKRLAYFFIIALSVSGCAAQAAMAVAPAAAQAVGVLAGSQYVQAKGKEMDGQMEEETAERCEAITKTPPGVEEIRKNKDGSFDSRQWHVGSHNGAPAWTHAAADQGAYGGWAPRAGLEKLNFAPPLGNQLEEDEPKFIVYAPDQTAGSTGSTDTETFDTMTSAFGAGQGKFSWRGRKFAYVMVSKLPCFKPVK